MFESATLKLTAWYLLILMIISILFSVTIFQIASQEINSSLKSLENSLQIGLGYLPSSDSVMRMGESREAAQRMSLGLVYANLLIFVSGGIGSFLLARRTLRPIQEAHEAQSRFTSDASHELRTPLAAMKAEIEVALRDKDLSSSNLQHVLRSNLEEVEKLSRLSEMLLSLSRLDHDNLERMAINLADTTKDVLRHHGDAAKRVSVKKTAHSLIEGNDAAIFELISILVDNAIKYSPSDSPIVITLSKRSRHAYFEITNTGPGIDSARLPYIFDRFYRADTSRTKTAKKGYGLGLSLAKKIVELHNGELSASSTPGEKTSFSFSLPNLR